MELKDIILEQREDHILLVSINRPKALNALNRAVFDGLEYAFGEYRKAHPELIGIIVSGSGDKAFAAGADIKEFSSLNAEEATALSRRGQLIFQQIEDTDIPVIAAVEGFSLGGGCELAMACHLRIASEKAKFGQPEVNLGLIPGYGGTQRLKRLVGHAKALELLMTADMVGGAEARQLGLANHCVAPGETMNKSIEIIHKIATKGPIAVANCLKTAQIPFGQDGYLEEARLFGASIVSDEAKEGIDAFVSKRKAAFKRS